MSGLKNFSINPVRKNSIFSNGVNKKNKGLLKFLIGGVVFLFLLVVLNFFTAPIKNCFYNISSPIQKTFWSAGESSSSFFSSFLKAESLLKENENLKNENQKLLSQIAFLQSIEQGNQAQSDISEFCQNNGFKTVMAETIGLDEDILSIDKGSADGITIEMPVINQENVLVGKIFKVYKNSSQIMLISNKNSVVIVKVQQNQDSPLRPEGYPEITGLVRGNGGLSAYLDSISIISDINPGDVLITHATDPLFPKDLLVGKITKVEKNDQNPHQQAQISLFFDVRAVDNLFVITNYKQ